MSPENAAPGGGESVYPVYFVLLTSGSEVVVAALGDDANFVKGAAPTRAFAQNVGTRV